MFDPMQDESDIRAARSAYNARKSESSLIAWICSPEWTSAIGYDLPGNRGSVKGRSSYGVEHSASGEIQAYTRDHVDGFAQGEGL